MARGPPFEEPSVRLNGELAAVVCAMLGLFFLVAGLGEPHHRTRLFTELVLLVPLLCILWRRNIRS